MIPFSVSREDAEKGFKDYVCKKKFVPRAFYNKKQVESITGVYFPYWHYNTRLEGKMQGEGEKCSRVANRKHGIYGDKVLSGIKRR